jgi:peptide/nickel transport system substrate-binding protein
MDQALVDLRVARNDDQRRAVLTKVNTVWNRTYPLVNVTTNAFTTTYTKKVHGLRYSSNGVALFDQAWLAK